MRRDHRIIVEYTTEYAKDRQTDRQRERERERERSSGFAHPLRPTARSRNNFLNDLKAGITTFADGRCTCVVVCLARIRPSFKLENWMRSCCLEIQPPSTLPLHPLTFLALFLGSVAEHSFPLFVPPVSPSIRAGRIIFTFLSFLDASRRQPSCLVK